MQYGIALIDKAAELCGGSYYKLSKAWGVSQGNISQYRHGQRPIPIKKVPKLAVLAGVDPQEAYLRVSVEQMPEGSEERDLLGNVMATFVTAMWLTSVALALLLPLPTYAAKVMKVELLYIVECLRRRSARICA